MIAAGYVYLSEQEPVDLLGLPLQHLTHLIVSFADVSTDLVPVWTPNCDPRAVKVKFPGLKVLLAVGGWTWSGRFSDAALTEDRRARFAAEAARLLEVHGFDGFDVDWEFPAVGGLPENVRRPEDRRNFTLLLEALRAALGPQAILTAAVGAGRAQIEALETDQFHRSLDFLNVMTYDFHGSWNAEPGDNSSLADTEASIRLHLERGFPAKKLVVGTPLYAHQWVRSGSGWSAGPVLLWHEVQHLIRPENAVFDEARGADRLVDADRWLTYDGPAALAAKADLVRRLNLGGLMTWQVTGDTQGLQLARMVRSRNQRATVGPDQAP